MLPGKWQRWTKLFALTALATGNGLLLQAQCTWPSGVSGYGTATASASCVPVSISASTGCHYFNEYGTANGLTVGQSYTITVTNASSTGGSFTLGVYTSTSAGAAPLASASSATFPISVTFTATTTTVYTKAFEPGCVSLTEDCNYYSIQNNSGTAPTPSTVQASTASIAASSLDAQVLRLDIPVCGPSTMTSMTFATTGSTNPSTDISRAKVYYTTSTTFATTTLFGTPVLNPNGTFTVNGSQAITSGTGSFWLAYDVACGATSGNVLDAELTSYTLNGTATVPATPNPTGTRTITAAGSVTAPAYTATTTTNTAPGTNNLSIGRVLVQGTACSNNVTEVKFNTATSPAADLTSARCFYTTSGTFSSSNPFGTPVVNPNGTITFTGTQNLIAGTNNYFWLTYDIPCNATGGDSLVATPVSIIVNGVTTTLTTPASNTKKGIVADAAPAYVAATTTSVVQGTTNLAMGRTGVSGTNCATAVTEVRFNTASSPVANISQARCYYTTSATFATTTAFGTAVASPNGDIVFTGSQTLASGTGNYFWLAYDVTCGSNLGDSLVATPVSITTNANVRSVTVPATNAKKGIIAPAATTYTATSTTSVANNTTDFPMGRMVVTGTNCVTSVTGVKFNTATTPIADISQAKCYYTTTTTFATTTPFGAAVTAPNGDVTFTGSQTLASGSGNYFWLTYDVGCNANAGDSLVAVPVNITTNLGSNAVTTPASNTKKGITATSGTIADGDWTSPATWSCGVVPTSLSTVTINHNVTVTTAGNTSGSITITSGKSLTIQSGDLTLGPVGGGNKTLANNGTLTVTGGTLNVNGSLQILSGSTFNQSGGNINVDGNAAGIAANSVPSGTSIVAFGTSSSSPSGTLNLTGGKLTIVDPHTATSAAGSTSNGHAFNYWGPGYRSDAGHTVQLGNPASTDPGGNTSGLQYNTWPGSGYFIAGNLIVDMGSGTNRDATAVYTVGVEGNLTLNSGQFISTVSTLAMKVNGNILVNTGATLTMGGPLAMAKWGTDLTIYSSYAASPNAQTISGGGSFRNSTSAPTANFNSLVINNSNPAGVTFADANSLLSGSNTGTVSGTLTMTAGVINTGSNTLVVGVSVAAAGTYTYTAGMITGKLKRWIGASTGSRVFNLGSSSGAKTATINFTTAPTAAGSLTAEWVAGNGGTNGLPLTEGSNTFSYVSGVGYWRITAGDGLAGGTYTATFNGAGVNDVADYTKLTIGKRSDASAPWTLNGTYAAPTGSNSSFTVSRTGITTGFSEFGLLSGAAPLPVKLLSFTGKKAGMQHILDWTTAEEKNFSHFELQRSADGRSFSKLAIIPADKLGTGTYTFTDQQPQEGLNIYQLRMVDADGAATLSHMVRLTMSFKGNMHLEAFPNPVRQQLTIRLSGKADGIATIRVMDLGGRTIQTVPVTSSSTTIDMSRVAAGTYLLQYTDNSNQSLIKISKQ